MTDKVDRQIPIRFLEKLPIVPSFGNYFSRVKFLARNTWEYNETEPTQVLTDICSTLVFEFYLHADFEIVFGIAENPSGLKT